MYFFNWVVFSLLGRSDCERGLGWCDFVVGVVDWGWDMLLVRLFFLILPTVLVLVYSLGVGARGRSYLGGGMGLGSTFYEFYLFFRALAYLYAW